MFSENIRHLPVGLAVSCKIACRWVTTNYCFMSVVLRDVSFLNERTTKHESVCRPLVNLDADGFFYYLTTVRLRPLISPSPVGHRHSRHH